MNQIETARHCLRLIKDIADRGAASSDPANGGYALPELREVGVETAGAKERLFEPVPENEIVVLEPLLTELQFIDALCRTCAKGIQATEEANAGGVLGLPALTGEGDKR